MCLGFMTEVRHRVAGVDVYPVMVYSPVALMDKQRSNLYDNN